MSDRDDRRVRELDAADELDPLLDAATDVGMDVMPERILAAVLDEERGARMELDRPDRFDPM